MPPRYTLIVAFDEEDLETLVNEKLAEGWTLYGSPSLTLCAHQGKQAFVVAQALTTPDDF